MHSVVSIVTLMLAVVLPLASCTWIPRQDATIPPPSIQEASCSVGHLMAPSNDGTNAVSYIALVASFHNSLPQVVGFSDQTNAPLWTMCSNMPQNTLTTVRFVVISLFYL